MLNKRIHLAKSSLIFILFLLIAGGITAVFLWFQHSRRPDAAQLAQTYWCDDQQMNTAQIAARRGISLDMLTLLHEQRGLTPPEICAMPDDKLARAIQKAEFPKPDQPDEAIAWRLLQLQDENGFIPADGYAVAASHMAQMQAEQAKNQPETMSFAPVDWTWLGPGNVGGRVRSIIIDPEEPDKMWVGSIAGGIWATTDGGAMWQPVDDFMANLAVSTLVMDPGNSNVIYAGTGEGFYNGDAIRGAGVFKSTDGGSSWIQLNSTTNFTWYWVNRLAIHPTDSQILLAATGYGIRRTTDGGDSWTTAISDIGIKDVDFHPNNGNLAIASGSYGRAYYSTNGGSSWKAATGWSAPDWLDRVEVAYAPSDPNTVYASVNTNGGELWRSTNGGQSYTLMNSGSNYLGGQGWYDNIIWVDPTNASTVIVGGIDLWRSTNSGASLSKISQWWSAPNSAHADHHAIVAHPDFDGTTNRTVYFGNDGGVYRADNVYTVSGTTGWQELNNNLGITQFYGAAGNAQTGVIVGGTQDNGTLRYAGDSEGWTRMAGGDGGFSAADPTDSNYFYGEYQNFWIHRSTNGGLSSSGISTGISDAGSCANFIAPFILDPNNADRMLAGGCSLWRSNNVKAGTPSWTEIKSAGSSNISAIAVAEGNSDVIWIGRNRGEVYKTTNGTAVSPTWTAVDVNFPGLPNRYVTRIAIDPQDHNSVYVTYGSFSTGNIWHTNNGGTTWQNISGFGVTGLPSVPVRSLVIHPEDSAKLYIGTEVGVFVSVDGGNTWLLPPSSPANVSVDELFWLNNKLVAATHGRGLFSVEVSFCTDAFEENNSTGAATAVSLGDTITNANICGANDVDYYAFTGQTGDKIFLDIDAQTLGSSLNSTIYLLDSDGTTILAQNDDEQFGLLDSKLGSTLPHNGTYYVKVNDYNYPNEGDTTYFYTLRLAQDEMNPATAQITAPQASAWIDPTEETITAVATDNESGIHHIEFLWHDDDWSVPGWVWLGEDTDGRDGWQFNFDSSSQPELQGGAFSIHAFDWTGNWAGADVENLGIDRTPPDGQMMINDGDTYANGREVLLNLNATDTGAGVAQTAVSNDSAFAGVDWITYQSPLSWTLPAGDGDKMIFVKFRDHAGNESGVVQDDIILDTTPPTGSIVIAGGADIVAANEVMLTLTANDQHGITNMRLREVDQNWQPWQPFTPSTVWILADSGGSHTVQVQFRDPIGNISLTYQDEVFYEQENYIYLPFIGK